MNRSTEARIQAAETAIRTRGWELRYVEFCEDAETPGIWIGVYAGVTDPERRVVKIRREIRSVILAQVLEHELRHVQDYEAGIPSAGHDWCGNRFSLADGLTIGSRISDPGRAS